MLTMFAYIHIINMNYDYMKRHCKVLDCTSLRKKENNFNLKHLPKFQIPYTKHRFLGGGCNPFENTSQIGSPQVGV